MSNYNVVHLKTYMSYTNFISKKVRKLKKITTTILTILIPTTASNPIKRKNRRTKGVNKTEVKDRPKLLE